MREESKRPEIIEWCNRVPIFRNPVIVKQLGLAIGIPFGLLAIILAIMSGKSVYALYALCLVGTLLLLTWLFILVVYGGKYEVEFVLDDNGALCRTQARQAKKNLVINALTIILGLFSGRPTVAGAGMLAQSRQSEFLKWNRVQKVKCIPRQKTILLKGGWAENMALFCLPENYSMAEQTVKNKTKHLKGV